MKSLDACSVDSCVTDPPYGLGFMGKDWDHGIPGVHFWEGVIRVLKPGAHLVAFGGTRTFHRLTCAIEDAGFEIRDCLGWIYASGFPKSHNLDNYLGSNFCGCEQTPERGLRQVRNANVPQAVNPLAESREVLQPGLSQPGASGNSAERPKPQDAGSAQPGMERRGDVSEAPRELRQCEIRSLPASPSSDGTDGRLCDGAPLSDGGMVRPDTDANGNGTSHRPRPAKQRKNKPRTLAGQPEPQASGAWPTCGRCGKPRIPRGLGTALKPAWEPIILARKPLSGTVAANVQEHGTGALNIDGCRIGTEVETWPATRSYGPGQLQPGGKGDTQATGKAPAGRWPANICHDGSEEVLAVFPETESGTGAVKRASGSDGHGNRGPAYGSESRPAGLPMIEYGDKGSASRFFYCAKASREDRNEGLQGPPKKVIGMVSNTSGQHMTRRDGGAPGPRENHHPTVKPTDLMRWLCRLITPKGGTVLDPFMGSGSTGKAADIEGFDFIGIEIDPEYAEIAKARITGANPLFSQVTA